MSTEGSHSLHIPAKPFPVTEAEGHTLLLLRDNVGVAPVTLNPHWSCSIPIPRDSNNPSEFSPPKLPFVQHLPYLIYLEILYIKVFSCQGFLPSHPDLRKKRLDTALGGMHWNKVAAAATENTGQTRELHMETSGKAGICTFQSC